MVAFGTARKSSRRRPRANLFPMKSDGKAKGVWPPKGSPARLPFEQSIGYQIRATHRALQRYLQLKIEPHNIVSGSWYYLRVLWNEDGLTQRELADEVGIREPTAFKAIKHMEAQGLVRRLRSKADRRKIHVWLTPKGNALKDELIPLARHVVATAARDLTTDEVLVLLEMLAKIQLNLNAAIERVEQSG
jgi:MarR family transcriptional regulator, organic hydroperoxide resistance regulator